MGKVYEAMERAEKEELKHNLSAVPVSNAFNPSTVESGDRATQFDFLDYSLNAKTTSEAAQRTHEEALAVFARHAMVEPVREVALDLSRIDPHLVTFSGSNLVAAEQYNKLAISMISEKADRALKKILIASTHRAEGRTCVALNLAGALARARQRVLVIDADLQCPSLLHCLGLEAERGLAEVIRESLAPGQATIKIKPGDFQILPTREPVDNPTDLLTAPRFQEVLALLESEYDFILFDSSPLLRVNDTNLLVRMTDAIVFVIRAGKTSSIQLGKAVRSFTQNHIFGVVLNRTEAWANQVGG